MVDFAWWEAIGLWIDSTSGVLFGLLGIAVAIIGPRTALTASFSLFAISFGVNRYFINQWYALQPIGATAPDWVRSVEAGTAAVVVVSIIWLTTRFPSAPADRGRVFAIIAGVLAVFALADAVTIAVDYAGIRDHAASQGLSVGVLLAQTITYDLRIAAMTAFVVVQAVRWSNASEHSRKSVWIATWAMLLPIAVVGAFATFAAHDAQLRVSERYGFALLLGGPIAAAAWLWATRGGPHARTGRNLAVGSLSLAAALAVVLSVHGQSVAHAQNFGYFGLVRIVSFSMLAYAVLRHQMLDIDLRLKFGIKHSTVVAIVIAVFVGVQTFVSEYFTDSAGLWAGAVAMGVMVLAIRPLQSLGQKVADRAMPNVRPLTERSDDERVEMYRRLAESAWSDGALSRAEGRVLETAREQLGLTADQAMKVEAAMRG